LSEGPFLWVISLRGDGRGHEVCGSSSRRFCAVWSDRPSVCGRAPALSASSPIGGARRHVAAGRVRRPARSSGWATTPRARGTVRCGEAS